MRLLLNERDAICGFHEYLIEMTISLKLKHLKGIHPKSILSCECGKRIFINEFYCLSAQPKLH
jgi:hypothetical protein